MAQLFHIRTINGVVPPVPSQLNVTQYVVDKDSYRNANGDLLRNILTSKMKFEITFPYTTKTQLQTILSMLNSNKFTVTYEDMINNTILSGEFYHNDISVEPYWIKSEDNTQVIYKPFSVNLIEY